MCDESFLCLERADASSFGKWELHTVELLEQDICDFLYISVVFFLWSLASSQS